MILDTVELIERLRSKPVRAIKYPWSEGICSIIAAEDGAESKSFLPRLGAMKLIRNSSLGKRSRRYFLNALAFFSILSCPKRYHFGDFREIADNPTQAGPYFFSPLMKWTNSSGDEIMRREYSVFLITSSSLDSSGHSADCATVFNVPTTDKQTRGTVQSHLRELLGVA